jgi:D-glycero-D-manno-heptose 1,7-bisphosphate phosphatase
MQMSKKRFVLLDRDGTINVERHYLSSPEQIELLPNAALGLEHMQGLGLGLAIITNQSGIARGYFDLPMLQSIHSCLQGLLLEKNVSLKEIFVCPHRPEDACWCRKPNPGLVEQAAAKLKFRFDECIVIGDKPCDIDLGRNIGAVTILVTTGHGASHVDMINADYVAADLLQAAYIIENL